MDSSIDLLSEYSDIFATQGTPPAQTTVVKHSIKTTGAPIRQPLRRTPVTLKDTIDQEVTRMLQQGIVRPSTSPWSSPMVMVKNETELGDSVLIVESLTLSHIRMHILSPG